jgi:protein SCO1
MPSTTRRKILGLLGLAPIAPVAGRLLTTSAAAADAGPSPRDRIRRRYFPNVSLQTQEGKWVRFYDDLIKDKIVTINFFYAKCRHLPNGHGQSGEGAEAAR